MECGDPEVSEKMDIPDEAGIYSSEVELITCECCGNEQADMGKNVACEECGERMPEDRESSK